MSQEQVDIIDSAGEIIRQAAKVSAHEHGWLHKTVAGYLREGDDWILVKQAADKQEPEQIVSAVGGHVKAGESVEHALLREAEEEIGAHTMLHKYIGTIRFHREVIGRNENHLHHIYEIFTDDPIKLNEESTAVVRMSSAELKRQLAERPQDFGDSLYLVLENFYPDLLPKNWQVRWSGSSIDQ